jgi:hypothetical protein
MAGILSEAKLGKFFLYLKETDLTSNQIDKLKMLGYSIGYGRGGTIKISWKC